MIGRFVSADSVVPGAGNPQALNRYSYSYNNPLKYNDPSGHCPNNFCYFAAGFFAQIGYNSNPIPSGYVGSADALAVQPNEADAMLYGRLAGSAASGVLSYVEIAAGFTVGTGGGIGGALACVPTAGGGCVVGAGAVALGAGLVTEGVLTGARTAQSAGQTAAILMAKGRGKGPSLDLNKKFRFDPDVLETDFQRHGTDMGFENAADYEQGAINFIKDKNIERFYRERDKVWLFFNRETGEFAALQGDTITTYFVPGVDLDDALLYWQRQIGK